MVLETVAAAVEVEGVASALALVDGAVLALVDGAVPASALALVEVCGVAEEEEEEAVAVEELSVRRS